MAYIDIITGREVSVPVKHYDFQLDLAHFQAKRSKDEDTKVGCVITDNNMFEVSMGYNGPNHKAKDNYFNMSRTPQKSTFKNDYSYLGLDRNVTLNKHPFIIHAEMNAIMKCTNVDKLKGSIAFVTHHTCTTCLNTLIQAGVGRVVVDDNRHSGYTQMLPEILYLLENSDVPNGYYIVRTH